MREKRFSLKGVGWKIRGEVGWSQGGSLPEAGEAAQGHDTTRRGDKGAAILCCPGRREARGRAAGYASYTSYTSYTVISVIVVSGGDR